MLPLGGALYTQINLFLKLGFDYLFMVKLRQLSYFRPAFVGFAVHLLLKMCVWGSTMASHIIVISLGTVVQWCSHPPSPFKILKPAFVDYQAVLTVHIFEVSA